MTYSDFLENHEDSAASRENLCSERVFFPIPALLARRRSSSYGGQVGCESRFTPSSRLGLQKNPSFIKYHLLGGLH
jgi:hypothetical protein